MNQDDEPLSDEYDFREGVRGKYAKRMPEGSTTVAIDPELAKAFPTERAVNEALRELLRIRSAELRR